MYILLDSFKTRMRSDFDSTFAGVDKRVRMLRKELLELVSEGIEDSEDRTVRN